MTIPSGDPADSEALASQEPNFRLKVALTAQYILRIRRHARESFDFSPVDFEVFLTVASATVDKITRDPQLRAQYSTTEPLPQEQFRHLSARSVCAATGLNRETVRRSVNDLVERGWLKRSREGYSVAPGTLTKSENVAFFLATFGDIRQFYARWVALEE